LETFLGGVLSGVLEADEEAYDAAAKKYYELDGRKLTWGNEKMKTCHACGSPDHIVVNCTEIKRDSKPKIAPNLQRLYARYRPAQHKKLPKSYADAARRPTNSNRNQHNGYNQGESRCYQMKSHDNTKIHMT